MRPSPGRFALLPCLLLCLLLTPFETLAQESMQEAVPPFEGDLEAWLRAQPRRFGRVMADPAGHRLQILYTRIDRDAQQRPRFTYHGYRLDADEYFYPASTVKLPTALVALENLDRWSVPGLDRDTTMLTGAAEAWQTAALVDPTSVTGLPSVGQYVRRILLVSDNDAFNRLYEFVGQDALNRTLASRGFHGIRIVHRLELALDAEANRRVNPVRFQRDGRIVFALPQRRASAPPTAVEPILLGRAEIVAGARVPGPKDFAGKNALPLATLHDLILALVFPDAVPRAQRWQLSEDTRRFVLRAMASTPAESGIEALADRATWPDGYVKFLVHGGSEQHTPGHLRIFNKVGDAYGFLTDAAYVADFEQGVEFLLAATLYVNANDTFNDDDYEYDEIGLPFLRELGRAILALEVRRPRAVRPDLAALERLFDAD